MPIVRLDVCTIRRVIKVLGQKCLDTSPLIRRDKLQGRACHNIDRAPADWQVDKITDVKAKFLKVW